MERVSTGERVRERVSKAVINGQVRRWSAALHTKQLTNSRS